MRRVGSAAPAAASNELDHHFLDTIDTQEKYEAKRLKLAVSVWRTIKTTDSRECRNCNNSEFIDFTVQVSRSRERYAASIDQSKTASTATKVLPMNSRKARSRRRRS